MAEPIIRPFQPSDGNFVQLRLRSAWRVEIPKQFNLTQVIAEQPLGHAIVAACVAIFYATYGEIGMLCLALPGFYIALYFVVLIVFFFHLDTLLLKELADVPMNYQGNECSQFWVAERQGDDKQIVGTIGLMSKSETLAQIRHLLVDIDQPNKAAILKQLLFTSLEFAKRHKFSEVEVLLSAADEDTARLFEQVGLKSKNTFFIPSKHLYILPMQVLHVKVDEMKLE